MGRKDIKVGSKPVSEPEEPAGEAPQDTKHLPETLDFAEVKQVEMELDVLGS